VDYVEKKLRMDNISRFISVRALKADSYWWSVQKTLVMRDTAKSLLKFQVFDYFSQCLLVSEFLILHRNKQSLSYPNARVIFAGSNVSLGTGCSLALNFRLLNVHNC